MDLSKNKNNGTLVNATQAATEKGIALILNGSSSYVDIPYSASLALVGKNITISALFYKKASTDCCIVGKPFAPTHIDPYLDWCIFTSSSQNLSFRVGSVDLIYTGTFQLNTWLHVVCTANGTDQSIYLNGVLVATTASAGLPTNTNSRNIYIGRTASSNEYFNGLISDVSVYSVAKSAAEIKSLSENPWQIFKPRKRVIYFDAPSFPVLSSLAVSEITSSGGRLTAN